MVGSRLRWTWHDFYVIEIKKRRSDKWRRCIVAGPSARSGLRVVNLRRINDARLTDSVTVLRHRMKKCGYDERKQASLGPRQKSREKQTLTKKLFLIPFPGILNLPGSLIGKSSLTDDFKEAARGSERIMCTNY